MKDLYVIGAGGFGRETAWLVERINDMQAEWNLRGFIDDNEAIHGKLEGSYTVLGGCGYLEELKEDYWVVCAVGNAKIRKAIIKKIERYPKIHFATLVDPDVRISNRVDIQEGTIICAGNIITVDVEIGRHNIINLGCTIGHDAILKDYVTLYPSVNISGMVSIGEAAEIGTGTQIIQGKNIGYHSIIGAGAVVVKDMPDNVTAVGSPAKIIRYHDSQAAPSDMRRGGIDHDINQAILPYPMEVKKHGRVA